MKILLETNAYVAFVKGDSSAVRQIRSAQELVFSTIVLGELLFGFRNGERFEKNMTELKSFLANPRVTLLNVTAVTADRFSRIAASLKRKGTPIPSNDIWIAAQTVESGAELVTLDKHFDLIDGLVLANV